MLVSDVAEATEEIHSVLRGPSAKIAFDAEGNPTKAAEGFARKNGLTASELSVARTPMAPSTSSLSRTPPRSPRFPS